MACLVDHCLVSLIEREVNRLDSAGRHERREDAAIKLTQRVPIPDSSWPSLAHLRPHLHTNLEGVKGMADENPKSSSYTSCHNRGEVDHLTQHARLVCPSLLCSRLLLGSTLALPLLDSLPPCRCPGWSNAANNTTRSRFSTTFFRGSFNLGRSPNLGVKSVSFSLPFISSASHQSPSHCETWSTLTTKKHLLHPLARSFLYTLSLLSRWRP